MQILISFFLGAVISFLGQLPLGTLSITATQIAVQETIRSAWKFAWGVVLIEMIYLRIVLSGMQWILAHSLLLTIFNWATVFFFLFLGVMSFLAARKQTAGEKAILLNNRLNRFVLGMTLAALNPAQIPFWFIWSGYFIQLGVLLPGNNPFNFFTLGSGLGTLAGLLVYMYGGNWLVVKMKTSNQTLNKIMGIIFIVAATAQVYRIFYP